MGRIKKITNVILKFKHFLGYVIQNFPLKNEFGFCASNVTLQYPIRVDSPSSVFLYENTKIRPGLKIINTSNEKVEIRKYSVIAPDVTIITNNHRSTVSVPQVLLGRSHVNDKSTNIIIEEDVWVGCGALLLPGAHLGRGCIVGANTIVSKKIPPYCVVVGPKAKIIKIKFSKEEILKHEKSLYNKDERLSEREIEDIISSVGFDTPTYGTSTLSESDATIIEKVKKNIGYIET